MRMTGAKALLESLKREGVRVIFGYPGGAVIPIYDAIYERARHSARPGAPRARRRATWRMATPRSPARSACAWRPPDRVRRTW